MARVSRGVPNEAANLIAVFDIGAGRSVVDFLRHLLKVWPVVQVNYVSRLLLAETISTSITFCLGET